MPVAGIAQLSQCWRVFIHLIELCFLRLWESRLLLGELGDLILYFIVRELGDEDFT